MSAVPAYSYDDSLLEQQRYDRPDISVVAGSGRAAHSSSLSPSIITFAKIAVVLMVIAAVVSFVSITFNASTISAAVEADAFADKIEVARAEAASLEVSQSSLANPARIKREAKFIGMAAPGETGRIELEPDIVVTDANGNLSLSMSVAAVATR